ncbi:MAG: AAA family ATPase, partial [Nevskia sp.]|nr:AAA family ATPase [Nevskia sp.]
LGKTVRDVLLEQAKPAEVVQFLPALGFSVMPANSDMTEAEIKLREVAAGDFALKLALEQIAGDYDYMFLDCPPALSKLTVNAFVAADGVLIPMQCEYYALEGLTALVDTINKIRRVINPGWRSRACCAPCTIRATTWPTTSRHSCWSISATRSTAPWCRATCAWPRPPATACR